MEIYTFLFIALNSTLAFVGLIGAFTKSIYIGTILGGNLKHNGKQAVAWGMLVFCIFIFFPMILSLNLLKTDAYSLPFVAVSFGVGLLLAIYYRKYLHR